MVTLILPVSSQDILQINKQINLTLYCQKRTMTFLLKVELLKIGKKYFNT